MIENGIKKSIGDFIICIAVLSQPAMILLQYLLACVLGIELEDTTIYRVALTVIFLVPAILVSFFRKPVLFISVLSFFVVLLTLTVVLYPENTTVLKEQSLRFLLPVVVPSFICMLTVRDINVIKTSLQIVGWLAAIFAVLFLLFFLMGYFSIDKYSLSFSYACLFPMLVLYNQKRLLSIIISVIIFFEVVAFGSRGAAVFFVLYVLINLYKQNSKKIALALFGVVFILIVFPFFLQYIDKLDISSRSVNLMMEGDFWESVGRDTIYDNALNIIRNNPITGIGLYGDRVVLGTYCHNIVLEVLVDFGLFIGTTILICFSLILIKALLVSKFDAHNIAVVLLFSGLMPHIFSGSYLQEPYFAILMGYCVWLINNKHNMSNNPVGSIENQ